MNKSTFDTNNIYYGKKCKNTIIPDSHFQNIFYSNGIFVNTAPTIKIRLRQVFLNESFNKYKLMFNKELNSGIIQYINDIERNILERFEDKLSIDYSLTNDLKSDNIRLINITEQSLDRVYNTLDICIKITGIWFNKKEKGLNYKFIYM